MNEEELKNKYSDPEKAAKEPGLMPYAHHSGSAVIKPTKEGVIRSKALSAMEEQTDLQLEQIKKQIELLAQQAQQIQLRKEISYTIYNSRISFQPVIGKEYFLYEKEDESYLLSMIGPAEWGRSVPYKRFVARVKLAADHTWVVMEEI